ncbi:MAG: histidinol-phosphatase HisJ family protein [Lachnospiraceae bacterium]|nr:histidinol-phosphatase HisJ family protein [Lachnospiraceae bacterium]
MAIRTDYHLHSSFSGDSEEPMEESIKRGIQLGLTHMCFTEHMDLDFPEGEDVTAETFLLNTDSYLFDLVKFREKYEGKIRLLFGVELGLQPHLKRELASYVKAWDFDFIIGSSHVCNRRDPYYASFYEGRSEEEAYREYFASILDNIKAFSDFDVYGHLDYVVRYGPSKDRNYTYDKYKDILDAVLQLLIDKGKGIEINTSGLRSGLKEPNPCTGILKRYRQLGGEIITVGSDAHRREDIAFCFDEAREILLACGFKYYTIFEKRYPEFKKL